MDLMGLCSICGKPGMMHTCILCGKNVCSGCFDHTGGVCRGCSTHRR